jgi:hypothetical protein
MSDTKTKHRPRQRAKTATGLVRPSHTCPYCTRDTYLAKNEAREVYKRIRRNLPETHRVYGCPTRDGWFHIGTPPTT